MYSPIEIFNQTLGYGGTLVSCFIKFPVIVNILRRKNYDGLSAASMVLETSAYIATMWYNVYRDNAWYTYGDLVATVIQNSIIVLCMLYFGPQGKGFSIQFLMQFFIVASMYFIFLFYILQFRQLQFLVLYGAVIPVISRVSQVQHNFRSEGELGVQSPYTALNSFLRPCIKLYYALTVLQDPWLQTSSFINVILNAILLFQVTWLLPWRQRHAQHAKEL